MTHELQALQDNHTWNIIPCPAGVKLLECNWIYTIKLQAYGTINRYKTRLVALRNRSEYGFDYEETFAPMANMTTVCTILAITTSKEWPFRQIDMKNAFLYGELKEEICTSPPPEMFSSPTTDVCRSKQSLYGLKQAS